MVVVYSSDEKYARIMAVSIISLFENNMEEDIVVYCFAYNMNEETMNQLGRIGEKYGKTVKCIDSKMFCDKYRFWEKKEDSRYTRLITDKILTNEEKVLYLDCDIMINSGIRDLFEINIDNYSVCGVLDTCRLDARRESNITDPSRYFNSGVLLINLRYWRVQNLYESFKRFKENNSNKGIYRDQRILNGICENSYLTIHPRYNLTPELMRYSAKQIKALCQIDRFYSQEEIKEAKSNPAIIHFAGRSIDRPWYKNCNHLYTDKYRKYMRSDIFTDFELFTESKKNALKWWIKNSLPFPLLLLLNKMRHI